MLAQQTKPEESRIKVVLHPRQMQAFQSVANEFLYGGATRGGKSYFNKSALIAWCTVVSGLQCFIFRQHYDDVIANYMEGDDGFRSRLGEWSKKGVVKLTENQVRWTRNGSLITLGHLSNDKALDQAAGVPKHVLVLDEATQILERRIRFLRAWVTMSEDMKDKLPEQLRGLYPQLTDAERREFFPKIIYTSNPFGPSAGYFRTNFVKARPRFSIGRAELKEGGFKRQYIPAKVEDNPSEDKEAVARRVAGLNDPGLSDALLNENWDAPIGDFFRQYDDNRHTCPDFEPPEHWFKFRTFDWGSSDPFCILWWAVSDGEPFKFQGKKLSFPRTSLVCYREWYGCLEDDHAKGLEMRNEDVAKGILERTQEKVFEAIITDSLPFQDRGFQKNSQVYKICDEFALHGVKLIQGNCARVYGWKQVRDRLIGRNGFPLIYFAQSCKYVREYLPALQYHPNPDKREDAQESGEATHASDCVRLACTTRPMVIDAPAPIRVIKGFAPLTPKAILEQMKVA